MKDVLCTWGMNPHKQTVTRCGNKEIHRKWMIQLFHVGECKFIYPEKLLKQYPKLKDLSHSPLLYVKVLKVFKV
jgi:hypothetical protein